MFTVAGSMQQQAAQQPSQEMPIDYSAQAGAAKQDEAQQMGAQQGGFPGPEADMSAAEAVAAALNMSAEAAALGLSPHVDHLGQVCCILVLPLSLYPAQAC